MTYTIKSLIFTYTLCLLFFLVLPVNSNAGVVDFVTSPIQTTKDIIVGGKNCNFVKDSLYEPFSDINTQFPVFGSLINKNGCIPVGSAVDDLFDTAFKVFIMIIILLAVVRISIAGIQWMTQDKSGSKTNARETLTNAVIGLVLALSSWLILYTVNPRALNLNKLSLKTGELGGLTNLIGQSPAGNVVLVDENIGVSEGDGMDGTSWEGGTGVKEFLDSLPDGDRGSDDSVLTVTAYSSTGDDTTDTYTANGIGNHGNTLKSGDVALSPDIIEKYKPSYGQSVFVNGTFLGYFNDTTGKVDARGRPIVNTIDLYNEDRQYGDTNSIRKVVDNNPKITFGSGSTSPNPQSN